MKSLDWGLPAIDNDVRPGGTKEQDGHKEGHDVWIRREEEVTQHFATKRGKWEQKKITIGGWGWGKKASPALAGGDQLSLRRARVRTKVGRRLQPLLNVERFRGSGRT